MLVDLLFVSFVLACCAGANPIDQRPGVLDEEPFRRNSLFRVSDKCQGIQATCNKRVIYLFLLSAQRTAKLGMSGGFEQCSKLLGALGIRIADSDGEPTLEGGQTPW